MNFGAETMDFKPNGRARSGSFDSLEDYLKDDKMVQDWIPLAPVNDEFDQELLETLMN